MFGYVLLLTTGNYEDITTRDGPDAPGLYAICWCAGVLMWSCSLGIVLLEMRVDRHAGRALRLWWLSNLLVSAPQLINGVVRLSAGEEALHRHNFVWLGLSAATCVLGLVAFFEPDTPSDRAYTMSGCADGIASTDTQRGSRSSSGSRGGSRGGSGSGQRGAALLGSFSSSTQYLPEHFTEALPPSNPNTEATASFFSTLSFSWCNDILALGSSHATDQDVRALLARTPHLTSLEMDWCPKLSDAVLDVLPSSLESLTVLGCARLSFDRLEALGRALGPGRLTCDDTAVLACTEPESLLEMLYRYREEEWLLISGWLLHHTATSSKVSSRMPHASDVFGEMYM